MLIIASKGKRLKGDTDAGFFPKEAAEEPEFFDEKDVFDRFLQRRKKTNGKILKSLETYYQHKGISPLDFHCRHWKECSAGNRGITKAQGAFVGTHYGKGDIPRLLFLSLDPANSKKEPEQRTVEFVRYFVEHECKVDEQNKSRHWYQTHNLAYILLKKFRPDIEISNSHLYFAHVNSVKCSMNNKDHSQAKPKIFRNCREYIGGEIAILKPDILVTQGKLARAAIETILEISPEAKDTQACSYKWISIGDKKTLWFHTHHPRYYGPYNEQRRDCFGKWAAYVYKLFTK